MERLGIGIVGAGFITHSFHIPAWVNVRDADITAICNSRIEKAEISAALCRKNRVGNPAVYSDVRALVQDPKVDAVWICVPNYARIPVMEEITGEVLEGRAKLVGVACEKPLARNVKEARKMLELVNKTGLLHGYLENQVFAPSVTKGKDILWNRAAKTMGRPYLARCAEEHSGPHEPWFWDGVQQGGGVLSDMMCHSHEVARFLLTSPEEAKDALKPLTVSAEIASLKWSRPEYIDLLRKTTGGKIDFSQHPVEDFARANVLYEAPDGNRLMVEVTTSWSFVGPGLRLNLELLGPEYYMHVNTLQPELNVFLSRAVKTPTGEDMVEKQNSENGLMPVIPDESSVYGYIAENRHMVESFLDGKLPRETWEDGLFVTELVMASYMAAEQNKTLVYPPQGLEEFVPMVAKGTWNPKHI